MRRAGLWRSPTCPTESPPRSPALPPEIRAKVNEYGECLECGSEFCEDFGGPKCQESMRQWRAEQDRARRERLPIGRAKKPKKGKLPGWAKHLTPRQKEIVRRYRGK